MLHLNYVFCRAKQDANKNRLYVHEVFVSDKRKKGDTLQTAASKPHGGISLYRDILANVLETVAKTEPQQSTNAVSDDSLRSTKTIDGINSEEPNGKSTVSDGKDKTKSANSQENQQKTDEKVEGPQNEEVQGGVQGEFQNNEPQPIGEGDFGPIYNQFKGNAKGAVVQLSKIRNGEATAALHHKDIGDIDIVWGNEGTGHSDGFGLAKLLKYHPEVVDKLQEIIDEMSVVSRSENRINLESEKYKAGVRLTWNEKKKTWLLTLFEKKNSASDNTTDTDETVNNGKLNDTATQQDTVSEGKDTTKSPTSQENQQKTDKKSDEGQHEVSDAELDKLFSELDDIFNGEANMVDFFSDEWEEAKPIDIGVKLGEHVSIEKLKALFDKFNNGENKEVLGKLAERVFSVAQNVGLDISFAEDENFDFGQQGKYKNDNTITYRHGFFTHPNIGNKSEVILHELIHAVTMYAMSDYRRGGNHLTPELKEACRTIYDVYEQIKNDELFSGEYGRKDAREMIAEMANPRFRDKLKKKNLWTRMVDAIKTIFGIKNDGTMQTTAFAQVD